MTQFFLRHLDALRFSYREDIRSLDQLNDSKHWRACSGVGVQTQPQKIKTLEFLIPIILPSSA